MTAAPENTAAEATRGLTAAEVAERVARGAVNDVPGSPTRTVGEIIRANVLTRFNLLLGVMLVVVLIVAPVNDALFGGVLIANTAIGIIQELRAKRTLDRLNLVTAPHVTVLRDGEKTELEVSELVLDDVVVLGPGDQVVVDGEVLSADGLEIDESLLTGESDPVAKEAGAECLSGSFVVAGSGRARATRVGHDAYATRLAEQARKFTLVRSELRGGIDRVLRVLSWILLPVAGVLLASQLAWVRIDPLTSESHAFQALVAGTVAMVPEGLVLLTSVAFAVSVVRLARRQVLVQELPAVEVLARVDTVCLDKTGTLTEGHLAVQEVVDLGPAPDGVSVRAVLGALAAADEEPNATLRAVASEFEPPEPAWEVEQAVRFSSARKWSGARFRAQGTWLLGAPEVVARGDAEVADRADDLAGKGRRVLLLAASDGPLPRDGHPGGARPVALVVLGDQLRGDAAATVEYFTQQGVAVKVISGDHPRTVAAIAREAGLPDAGEPVAGPDLPDDSEALGDLLEDHAVFGRVSPEQKRAMVQAMQARGHVVAMTGDGVNDVLALKDSDIGIALGSGTAAARGVAQVVLLDGRFATVPSIVAEGRRVIANIERVARLYLTKTVYALLMALAVAATVQPYPFLPRHLTLIGTLTIGIPSFVLALAPSAQRARPGFIGRVLRFAVPAGVLAALATLAAYALATVQDASLEEARTLATFVLVGIGLFVLTIISRPLTVARRALISAMASMLLVVFALPQGRAFFALDMPPLPVTLSGVAAMAVTGGLLYTALVVVDLARPPKSASQDRS